MTRPGSIFYSRAAQTVSGADVFQAMSYAALKARAGRIAPGGIISISGHDLAVAEDENGDGSVVQVIIRSGEMEGLALQALYGLDGSARGWGQSEKRQWLAGFWGCLASYLERWQQIKMRPGPGENFTFDKAVSK